MVKVQKLKWKTNKQISHCRDSVIEKQISHCRDSVIEKQISHCRDSSKCNRKIVEGCKFGTHTYTTSHLYDRYTGTQKNTYMNNTDSIKTWIQS